MEPKEDEEPKKPKKPEGDNGRGTDDDEKILDTLKFAYLCPNCAGNKFHLHENGSTSCSRCGMVNLFSMHFGWVPLIEDRNQKKENT